MKPSFHSETACEAASPRAMVREVKQVLREIALSVITFNYQCLLKYILLRICLSYLYQRNIIQFSLSEVWCNMVSRSAVPATRSLIYWW
jgi:hypothetical protein